MLTCNLNEETGLLEVIQVVVWGFKTTTSYWYYDTRKWLKSTNGKRGDAPDRVMSGYDIKWVRTQYLPLANQRLAA